MKKYLEIIILLAFLSIALTSLKLAYGAGSLAELQSEAKEDTSYGDELINYIDSHNMTNDRLLKGEYLVNVNTLNMGELEEIVKKHIQECEFGLYDGIATMANLTKDEISNMYGDC